jgi:threonine/homoserine/homoserine lactone efflux protein
MGKVLWLHAWGLGFGLMSAIPVGPATVVMIQRTLDSGRRHGLAVLLGLLVCEVLYIAAFVLGARPFLTSAVVRDSLGVAGALVLIATAISVWRGRPDAAGSRSPDDASDLMEGERTAPSPWTGFRDAFALTLTNPAIVLIVGGLVTGAGAVFGSALVEQNLVTLMLAMELGVVCWLAALIVLVGSAGRSRHLAGVRRVAARLAGMVLFGLAAYLIAATVARHLGQ